MTACIIHRRRRSPVAGCPRRAPRTGKILVVFAIILPVLVGIMGVVADGGLLTAHHRQLQNVTDAAATVAAKELHQGASFARATSIALGYVRYYNGLADARIKMRRPPRHGSYAGDGDYVELEVSRDITTYLVHVLGGSSLRTIRARSVAGIERSTADAAITVLSQTALGHPAGLSLVGRGTLTIGGAVLVNTEAGAVDEAGEPAGTSPGPPYGIRSNGPEIVAADIRVAGGVDDPAAFRQANLRANQLPVEDPLKLLRPPRSSGQAASIFGGVEIPDPRNRGRRSKRRTLQPGTYDWIRISAGRATFQPGVYIIRSVNPRTGVALDVQNSQVIADGVMFYIDRATPSWTASGFFFGPYANGDYGGGHAAAVSSNSATSVIIQLNGQSRWAALEDASSAYDGMLLFQNQFDPRVIQINALVGANQLAGIVYARSGHVSLVVRGTCRASFVADTMRLRSLGRCRLQPHTLLAPAEDVYLVE